MILLIKRYRTIKNLSVRELAFLAECSHSYITELENNKKKNPNLDIIDRVGDALDICPIKLFGGCYGNICSSKCYYYNGRYEEYNNLPPDGRIEVLAFTRYIKEKYKKYLS